METTPSTLSRRTLLASAATLATLPIGIGTAQAKPRHRNPPQAPDTVRLPDGLRPEGITSGPGSTFYVGSLADGRIVTGDFFRTGTRVLLAGAPGRALRGLKWDRRTGLVWAVGSVGAVAHVWAVDARSGTVVSDTEVGGAVFLNDLVIKRSAVWVTDSQVDRLTRIALSRGGQPAAEPATFVPLGGAWPAGDGVAINANGIRTLPDGSILLNNSRVGGLWQVVPRTGDTRQIPVLGGPGITGGDGLVVAGRTVFNVRGSGQQEVSMLRLHPDPGGRGRAKNRDWTARWIRALTDETLDVPSTATLACGSLWAVNARFGVADPGSAEYWITRLGLHR